MKTYKENYYEVCDKAHLIAFRYNTLEEARKNRKGNEIVVCVVHEKMIDDDGTFFTENISRTRVNIVDVDDNTANFNRILDIPDARQLIDLIEELIGETEPRLVEMRNNYIRELAEKYGYNYEI